MGLQRWGYLPQRIPGHQSQCKYAAVRIVDYPKNTYSPAEASRPEVIFPREHVRDSFVTSVRHWWSLTRRSVKATETSRTSAKSTMRAISVDNARGGGLPLLRNIRHGVSSTPVPDSPSAFAELSGLPWPSTPTQMHCIMKLLRSLFVLASALPTFCLFVPLSQAADGYGRNATGGAGGSTVTVTTAAALRTAAGSSSPMIINVSGTIDLGSSGRVDVKSNKTLHGVNSSATIKGTINLSSVNNIIIDHLNVTANTGAAATNDGISVNNSTNVYITKCTVFDCTDGGIDIAKGSDNVTVSWCKFYYTRNNGHNYANLIGSSDTDSGGYHITFHHNWWSTGCKQRMPADRFGPFHLYNNYWDCTGNDYCSTARNVTQMLAQHNYYQSVNNPLNKENAAKLRTVGNVFNNCTGRQVTSSDTVFTPPYGYTLDAVADVPNRVKGGAGNR